ncbi:DUF1983 domain-containing protein [Enterobacter wuhouensis]|uniref:DUF1983 domain-containing protein n=1 Tax=Enterobacter wuhouensis TaxID=2529381 RepID=A0A4V2LU06_9ENTR|nr:DUF1983 domain-containing protein [Enterobacter wuhouensis]
MKHLVNTRFGVPAGGYIGSPVDKPGRDIRCGCPIEGISWGWFVDKSGQAYIHKALIGDGVLSTSYNVKFHVADKGKSHEAGMAIGVEDGQSNVVEAAQSIVGKAVVSATKVKIKLGDELTQAVIDAVRESELFTAIQVNIDAQTASLTGLQQAMHDAVNDAIRNALKPGGAIWVQQRAC